MIEDAEKLPSGLAITADLCIVGAGAAGISLALQFAGTKLKVVLIESGGLRETDETRALYQGDVVSSPLYHLPPDQDRNRVFGGSTLTWTGRCVPYDPIDFEERPWIEHSGWPISFDDVARYYPAAMKLLEAGDFIYSATNAIPGGMRPMIRGFTPKEFSLDTIERFSCPTNFGARYGHRLASSGNVHVILNASCVKLETSPDGTRITKCVLRTLNGKQLEVEAKQNVLAMGGMEIPRLLLASKNEIFPNGLGNSYDNVGRYYMSHIGGIIGALAFTVPSDTIWHGFERAWDGVYCRRRIAITPEAQRRLGIGNAVFRLQYPDPADYRHRTGVLSLFFLAYGHRMGLLSRVFLGPSTLEYPSIRHQYTSRLQHAMNILSSQLEIAKFSANRVWADKLAVRRYPFAIVHPKSNVFRLEVHSEQMPNRESRIMLTSDRDALDMPRLKVHWHYSPLDIRTVDEGLKLLQAELAAWGGGKLDYTSEELEQCIWCQGAHHIGTVRMSKHVADGVVNIDCRVHGLENLYIASSGVFPTSSQANPTLTIVAMTLRLADYLKQRLMPVEAINISGGK